MVGWGNFGAVLSDGSQRQLPERALGIMDKGMLYRTLGASGIEASVVGLGTWAIGGWMWGGVEEKEAERAIRTALDEGITLVDTAPADATGGGASDLSGAAGLLPPTDGADTAETVETPQGEAEDGAAAQE